MEFPDCLGLNINEVRVKIFKWNKEIKINISETHSFKDNDVRGIEESIVVRQKWSEHTVDLTVAFF